MDQVRTQLSERDNEVRKTRDEADTAVRDLGLVPSFTDAPDAVAPVAATASCSCASSASPPRCVEVTSHSCGPNQITVESAPWTQVPGVAGSEVSPRN